MKLSAQCLAQSAMGALAQTTLLWYLARSLGPLLLIPSFTTSTSIGSSQRTPGLLPSPYPGVFFAKTTLSFFWLQTECPDTFTAGTPRLQSGFLPSCVLSKGVSQQISLGLRGVYFLSFFYTNFPA